MRGGVRARRPGCLVEEREREGVVGAVRAAEVGGGVGHADDEEVAVSHRVKQLPTKLLPRLLDGPPRHPLDRKPLRLHHSGWRIQEVQVRHLLSRRVEEQRHLPAADRPLERLLKGGERRAPHLALVRGLVVGSTRRGAFSTRGRSCRRRRRRRRRLLRGCQLRVRLQQHQPGDDRLRRQRGVLVGQLLLLRPDTDRLIQIAQRRHAPPQPREAQRPPVQRVGERRSAEHLRQLQVRRVVRHRAPPLAEARVRHAARKVRLVERRVGREQTARQLDGAGHLAGADGLPRQLERLLHAAPRADFPAEERRVDAGVLTEGERDLC
mmetsp:Transcript_40976/g.101865  ORF Transcript_40976/g.101865 Transcript_40976/m.101865 type:complete len:323 (+) Transcript_40976:484-1452(+)